MVLNSRPYQEFYAANPLVRGNVFLSKTPDLSPLPTFEQAKSLLPHPIWAGHQTAIDCYWHTWRLAFANLRQPTSENGFIRPYIDTAFNSCLFMWDSAFILLFARYGSRAFNFQQTLDNLYAKQHADGFITRELKESDGEDQFHRYDPISTGPNVLPWCEWEYFLNFGDLQRIREVFVPLLAYHRWTRSQRSWPDGSYWSCGLGCGMDNQPRVAEGENCLVSHSHQSWVDATAQALLSCRILLRMAEVIRTEEPVDDLREEAALLDSYINTLMWDEASSFFGDRRRDGSINPVRTVGAYWCLLAGAVSLERRERFIQHLQDEKLFNRPHRVPSLAANHPDYHPAGSYWLGGVWAPTNYMVLRGLTKADHADLAHEIGLNHHQNVVKVFEQTGTVWENYAPESPEKGNNARADFVGWSGLGPVAVLFEYVFGLVPNVPAKRLVWHVRLLEEHGVKHYPFGQKTQVDLHVRARANGADEPVVTASSTERIALEVVWEGGSRTMEI